MAPLPDFPLGESRRERDTEIDQNAGTFRGTECSNPLLSTGESATNQRGVWRSPQDVVVTADPALGRLAAQDLNAGTVPCPVDPLGIRLERPALSCRE